MSSIVRRHFLLRSSVTPTVKVERDPGKDSPAELLCDPCGTTRAGSCFPSFWKEFWGLSGESPADDEFDCEAEDDDEEPGRWSEFLALANNEPAFPLRRFLSPVMMASSMDFLPGRASPMLCRFSPPLAESDDGLSLPFPVLLRANDTVPLSSSSFGGDGGEWPNIRFNNPPWPERLRRLPPASLSVVSSRASGIRSPRSGRTPKIPKIKQSNQESPIPDNRGPR